MAKRKGSTDIQVALRYKEFHRLRTIGYSYTKIGRQFGYNHATVIYGVTQYDINRKVYDRIIENKGIN